MTTEPPPAEELGVDPGHAVESTCLLILVGGAELAVEPKHAAILRTCPADHDGEDPDAG